MGKTRKVYPTVPRHLEINDFMNDAARPLYQSACVSQTDLSYQESPWLLFLTRGGTGEMSVIDVGALPGSSTVQYNEYM